MKPKTGIVVEILSRKNVLKKKTENSGQLKLDGSDGHITHCIVLPRGCATDNIMGLKFQIDAEKGEDKGNVFYFGWPRILEVRTLDGCPIYRNWCLCPKCRRIAKSFYCKDCECEISPEENRNACISPFQEE